MVEGLKQLEGNISFQFDFDQKKYKYRWVIACEKYITTLFQNDEILIQEYIKSFYSVKRIVFRSMFLTLRSFRFREDSEEKTKILAIIYRLYNSAVNTYYKETFHFEDGSLSILDVNLETL